MVGGDYIQRNMSAAAIWGRIVNIAYQSGMQANVNFAPMLMKRLSLLATTLRARTNDEKGAIRDALLREVWPLIEAGKIKPVVDQRLSAGRGAGRACAHGEERAYRQDSAHALKPQPASIPMSRRRSRRIRDVPPVILVFAVAMLIAAVAPGRARGQRRAAVSPQAGRRARRRR